MRFGQLLNPRFIYRNRELIIPYLERHWTLRRFKNCHLGERCFVIGNGPSLLVSDLERLQSEVTFASNKIYLAFDSTEWRPTRGYARADLLEGNHRPLSAKVKALVRAGKKAWCVDNGGISGRTVKLGKGVELRDGNLRG